MYLSLEGVPGTQKLQVDSNPPKLRNGTFI